MFKSLCCTFVAFLKRLRVSNNFLRRRHGTVAFFRVEAGHVACVFGAVSLRGLCVAVSISVSVWMAALMPVGLFHSWRTLGWTSFFTSIFLWGAPASWTSYVPYGVAGLPGIKGEEKRPFCSDIGMPPETLVRAHPEGSSHGGLNFPEFTLVCCSTQHVLSLSLRTPVTPKSLLDPASPETSAGIMPACSEGRVRIFLKISHRWRSREIRYSVRIQWAYER